MQPTKTTPKDFFLNLSATIVLYIVAGAFLNLSFSVINYFFPDKLAGYFSVGSIAWPISMLIVLVPVLYILEWLINRDIKTNPDKANLFIRRWRIYLTIFLAAALMIGDLIALINVYLNGEITTRFIYKILVILVTSGVIGKYYFYSMYTHFRMAGLVRKANTWIGIVLVLASIILGFVAVGSPAKQRAIRFDNQRVNDLSNIQWRIVTYWQNNEKLPASLENLRDDISGFAIPTDPADESVSYEYIPQTGTSFQLCANFALATQDLEGRGGYGYGSAFPTAYRYDMAYPYDSNETWDHEAGRHCFDRTIDPKVYPPTKPMPVDSI